jgi:hypothetical protein
MGSLVVLVLGGYGFFGSRLCERLVRQGGLHVIVAGRSAAKAKDSSTRWSPHATSTVGFMGLDANAPLAPTLREFGVDVVINASGPFQGQDHRVARACIEAGVHHIDLADGREFVVGIEALNEEAQKAGVLVTSGASSVPALSSAVVDHLAHGLARVRHIRMGISPGNRTERGLSTIQGILSYCGQPIGPAGASGTGWLSSQEHSYAHPVGVRLHSPCDVPDLVIFPGRYPGHPRVEFGAGLELSLLHRGMNLMAWMAHRGWVRDWSRHARWLKVAADGLRHCGTDAGGMFVSVTGDRSNSWDTVSVERQWELIATHGDGPFVPTLAASALVRKIKAGFVGTRIAPGARPCVGLLSLEDFQAEMSGLRIRCTEGRA